MKGLRSLSALVVLSTALGAADVGAAEVDARDAVAEAGLTGGVRGWRTAYRKSSAQFDYGLVGGIVATPWLQIGGALDHAERSSTQDELRIRNTETWLMVGPRFGAWFQFLRLFGEAGAAGVMRTASYRDVDVSSPVRFAPGFGFGGGFTIAIAHRVGVTMRGSWRRRDDQAHILAALDVTWLFQPSGR